MASVDGAGGSDRRKRGREYQNFGKRLVGYISEFRTVVFGNDELLAITPSQSKRGGILVKETLFQSQAQDKVEKRKRVTRGKGKSETNSMAVA